MRGGHERYTNNNEYRNKGRKKAREEIKVKRKLIRGISGRSLKIKNSFHQRLSKSGIWKKLHKCYTFSDVNDQLGNHGCIRPVGASFAKYRVALFLSCLWRVSILTPCIRTFRNFCYNKHEYSQNQNRTIIPTFDMFKQPLNFMMNFRAGIGDFPAIKTLYFCHPACTKMSLFLS